MPFPLINVNAFFMQDYQIFLRNFKKLSLWLKVISDNYNIERSCELNSMRYKLHFSLFRFDAFKKYILQISILNTWYFKFIAWIIPVYNKKYHYFYAFRIVNEHKSFKTYTFKIPIHKTNRLLKHSRKYFESTCTDSLSNSFFDIFHISICIGWRRDIDLWGVYLLSTSDKLLDISRH